MIRLICSISDFPGSSGLCSRSSPRMHPAAHMSTPVVCVFAWIEQMMKGGIRYVLYAEYMLEQFTVKLTGLPLLCECMGGGGESVNKRKK